MQLPTQKQTKPGSLPSHMDPNYSSAKEDQKLLALKKKEESLITYHLVVKIISWKNGLLDGGTVTRANKITAKEWTTYRKHLLTISKTEGHDAITIKLKEIQQVIQSHGGFE